MLGQRQDANVDARSDSSIAAENGKVLESRSPYLSEDQTGSWTQFSSHDRAKSGLHHCSLNHAVQSIPFPLHKQQHLVTLQATVLILGNQHMFARRLTQPVFVQR